MKKCILAVLIIAAAMMVSGTRARGVPKERREYTVHAGDTLYKISREITPSSRDYRHTVYKIAEENGLKDGLIYVGQTITVPVWEE